MYFLKCLRIIAKHLLNYCNEVRFSIFLDQFLSENKSCEVDYF